MRPACLIVLVCAASGLCYPSKPLNERSTELAWQAWLLVDQSNRQQGELGLARRKITPKSVFIAPTFTPETLPACADGYKSDAMGRCIRIIKINESFHLDFLLEKLNQRFPMPEPSSSEELSTQGPLQFNIPLEEEDDEALQMNETEVAIVVAPSGGGTKSSMKVDAQRRRGGDKFDLEDVAAILRVKPESVEMTTLTELSTAITTTTVREEEEEETTTTVETTTATTEDAAAETSTMPMEGEALFFRERF